jgi:hypothetical protein
MLMHDAAGCVGMLCCIVLSILMMITHSNFGRGLKEKCKFSYIPIIFFICVTFY